MIGGLIGWASLAGRPAVRWARPDVTARTYARAMTVNPGRFTADIDGDFVVFMIGMRFNKPWKVRQWWTVFSAMPKMLRVLGTHPELGCLHTQSWFGRTTLPVHYWRSFEDLDRFAQDEDLPHLDHEGAGGARRSGHPRARNRRPAQWWSFHHRLRSHTG